MAAAGDLGCANGSAAAGHGSDAAGHGSDAADHGSGGTNIFQIPFAQLFVDTLIWEMLMYMVGFMIAVDLLLRLAVNMAEGDRTHMMFVNRLVGELCMFGAVAITFLVVDVSWEGTFSHHVHIIFEFVDIFCSVSASLLILIGIWCNVLLSKIRFIFTKMTMEVFQVSAHVDKQKQDTPDTAQQSASSSQHADWHLSRATVDFFIASGNVTKRFEHLFGISTGMLDFGQYVHQVIGQAIIDLIDLNAISWFVIGGVALVGFFVTRSSPEGLDDAAIVNIFVGVGWALFGFSAAIYLLLLRSIRRLRFLYGSNDVVKFHDMYGAGLGQLQLKEETHKSSPSSPSQSRSTAHAHSISLVRIPEAPIPDEQAGLDLSNGITDMASQSGIGWPGAVEEERLEGGAPCHCDDENRFDSVHDSSIRTSPPDSPTIAGHQGATKYAAPFVDRNTSTHESATQEFRPDPHRLSRAAVLEQLVHPSNDVEMGQPAAAALAHSEDVVNEMAQRIAQQLQCQDTRHMDFELNGPEEGSFVDPSQVLWAARHLDFIRQAMQTLMLCVASHLSFYLLNVLHNVELYDLDGSLHAALLLPSVIVLMGLLPHSVYLFGTFEAYAVPNAAVLDHVLSDGLQLDADLEHVRQQISWRLLKNKAAVIRQLRSFERRFKSHSGRMWPRAVTLLCQLCRGQLKTFCGRKHLFISEMLSAMGVMCSHERTRRLSDWVTSVGQAKDELDVVTVLTRLGITELNPNDLQEPTRKASIRGSNGSKLCVDASCPPMQRA